MGLSLQLPDPTNPADHDAWLAAVRPLPPLERLRHVNEALPRVEPLLDTASVFFRKKLLRHQDRARLEAGLVTREELQRENSPFPAGAFVGARIEWGHRLRG